MSDLELFELWQDSYISLWSDGEIGVSDGVGYVGNIDSTKTRELYEALRRHYGDDKRERDLTAMREQRDEAHGLIRKWRLNLVDVVEVCGFMDAMTSEARVSMNDADERAFLEATRKQGGGA